MAIQDYLLGPIAQLFKSNEPSQGQQSSGGLRDLIFGSPAQTHQLPTVRPDQLQFLMELLQGVRSGNPLGFAPIEAQARSDFAQKTIPTLAERFTSLSNSGGGALSSGALQSQFGQAGAGLDQGLAALKSQYGLQQLQSALMPTFENVYQQQGEGLLGPLLQAGGAAAGAYFGGPAGAAVGGSAGKAAGNGLSSLFNYQSPDYKAYGNQLFNQIGQAPFGANASPFQYRAGVL